LWWWLPTSTTTATIWTAAKEASFGTKQAINVIYARAFGFGSTALVCVRFLFGLLLSSSEQTEDFYLVAQWHGHPIDGFLRPWTNTIRRKTQSRLCLYIYFLPHL
jgi:hypothetical protein